MKIVGKSGDSVLFSEGDEGIVINLLSTTIEKTGALRTLAASANWEQLDLVNDSVFDLAEAALTNLDIGITASSGRLYTVPANVKAEVAKALAWTTTGVGRATPVAAFTASALFLSEQVTFAQVKHIASYFPRHASSKTTLGFMPKEKGFPVAERINWSMYGGNAAWKWSQSILDRTKASAITADGFLDAGAVPDLYDYNTDNSYDADLSNFYTPDDDVVEFIARVRLDGSGIDRLYKIDRGYKVFVWDDGYWTTLSGIDNDLASYDMALEEGLNLPPCETHFVEIDAQSALFISACLQESPNTPVSIFEVNPEEAQLAMDAAPGLDVSLLDALLSSAAVESGQATQLRDSKGRVCAPGGRVVVGDNVAIGAGVITHVDGKKNTVSVKLDYSGQSVNVSANDIQPEEMYDPLLTPATPAYALSTMLEKTLYIASLSSSNSALANESLTAALNEFAKASKNAVPAASINKAPKPAEVQTPDTAGVNPMFYAIVAQDDPTAVLQLVAIIPPSAATANVPVAFIRKNQKWITSSDVLDQLQSVTPPPVVQLNNDDLKSVISQVDGLTPVISSVYPDKELITLLWSPIGRVMIMTAAGSNAEHSGHSGHNGGHGQSLKDRIAGHITGAERLRLYWTVGKGGAKIAWGAPGDWTRCYRHLRKYLGMRAKGYCSLRHHEMTGMWPGDKANREQGTGALKDHGRGHGGHHNIKTHLSSYSDIITSEEVLLKSQLTARAGEARRRMLTASAGSGANESATQGAAFTIPLVIPEVVESGDGRRFEANAISIRDLPLPLMWQIKTGDGHDGAVIVGRIDTMERVENGIGNAHGFFDTSPYGKEAERLVRERFITGVSADLDKFEANQESAELSETEEDDGNTIGTDKLRITQARVMGVTIVYKPAFQECKIFIDSENNDYKEEPVIQDGVHTDELDSSEAAALVACGMVAGVIPVIPPSAWFNNPKLSGPTPLTVDDDGRVFGHIAAWHTDHIGMSMGTKPPRSRSNYAYFHTGVVRTDDGSDVPVGQLTLAGGHASLHDNAAAAAKHYDDTGSAVADVHAGEDTFGIWVSGALRPGTRPEQIRALRASAPSGDWRPIKNSLELVAVCQVNVPGFPIARARVASGAVMALVAAGAMTLAKMKTDPVSELSSRLTALEQLETARLLAIAKPAREKFAAIRTEKEIALSAKADSLYTRVFGEVKYADEFTVVSRAERERLAKTGEAMKDGSYPITNESSLKDAIHAYGRAKDTEKAAVRRHIIRRANALKKPELVPQNWKTASVTNLEEDSLNLRSRLAVFGSDVADATPASEPPMPGKAPAVESPEAGKFTPATQPRENDGTFRDVLARLKENLGPDSSVKTVEQIKEAEKLSDAGNYAQALHSAQGVVDTLNRENAGTLDPTTADSIRGIDTDLSRLVANLPFPTGNQTETMSYSEIPPVLQNLVESLIARADTKDGAKITAKDTADLQSFMHGGMTFTQPQLSSQLNKLLTLLR